LDETTAVVYLKDRQGRYLLINRQFEELFHVSKAEVVGKTDQDLFPVEVARAFRKNDLRVIETQMPVQFDEVAPHDDGPHDYVSVKFPLHDAGGELYAVCGISTDITQRKRAIEKLRDEDRILKKLLDLQERERRLVAYDIHDGFVQYVVGAKMILEGATRKLKDDDLAEVEALLQVEQLLAKAIEEGRRVIGDLRPMIIDEKGIVEAIHYLIAEAETKQKPAISFSHHVQFDRLDPLMEGAMFRIVQEALTNAQRHSQAEHVAVALTQVDDQVRLEIRDDGIGFDPSRVSKDRFGLDGIRKRGAGETLGNRRDSHSGIVAGESGRCDISLECADVGGAVQHLAAQVSVVDRVKVAQCQLPDTTTREVVRGRAADATDTDEQHCCLCNPFLTGFAHLRQCQVARIAILLRIFGCHQSSIVTSRIVTASTGTS
ncbi:MAG: PAS domain-containing protein, partial [Proteobacteria bacterium]|nr:PAS domain-containing protein [Pseudomonadota bacterium]